MYLIKDYFNNKTLVDYYFEYNGTASYATVNPHRCKEWMSRRLDYLTNGECFGIKNCYRDTNYEKDYIFWKCGICPFGRIALEKEIEKKEKTENRIKEIDKEMKEKKKKNYTYLISDGANIKIGKTIDLQKRFSSMCTGNVNLKFLFAIKRDVEKKLHDKYSDNRVYREWFKLADTQIDEIRACYSKYILTDIEITK